MNKDEIRKIVSDTFKDFKFFEEDHHYEYKGKRVGISVTRFIEQYSQEFDMQGVAEKVAIKENKEVYEILNEWEYKNKCACEKGHFGHEFAQSLWSGAIYQENIKSSLEAIKTPLNKVKQQALNFYNDYKDKLEHLFDECVVGSSEYDIASAIDHLFINKLTGEIVLVDYKTNSDIHKTERYAKNMKVPLNHLKDFTLNHYYIQLSIYKYLFEKYTGLKVDEMFIVYMSENIENYEIIDVPYLEREVKKILELRKERIMGKCIPILVIGKSGAGKSTSLRNLKTEEYSLVNPLGKRLPFKGGSEGLVSINYEEIKNFIAKTPKNIVVIDDSNYLLTMEMMAKAKDTGYGKFTDMALNYWKLIDFIKNLDGDKRIYLMSHEEVDEFGNVGVKTVGKMLTNQCCVEGLYTIVLRATTEQGKFQFQTATQGNDIVKTPMGMFESPLIDNDLKIVDDTICEYYGIEKGDKEND